MQDVVQDLKAAFGCRTDRDLAERLGVKPPTVASWKHLGVPALRWRKIRDKAAEDGVALPASFLALMHPGSAQQPDEAA